MKCILISRFITNLQYKYYANIFPEYYEMVDFHIKAPTNYVESGISVPEID